MRKTLAPSLAALASLAIASTAAGIEVEDKDLHLAIVLNLQARAEVSRAHDRAGGEYDVQTGTSGAPDTADFSLRRFRPGIKGTYQDDWKFAAILRADDVDRTFAGSGAASAQNRVLGVHQAYVARVVHAGEVEHTLQLGLDYAFFNLANSSNTASLLPNQRASQALLPVRGTGAAYRVASPLVRFGIDVQNNTGDSATGNGDSAEGLCYTSRIELTGPGRLGLRKWQETYLDQPGMGFIVGLEAGLNQHDRDPAGTSATNTSAYGLDVVFHREGLNALAEIRRARVVATAAAAADISRQVIDAQVGYAFHAGNVVLEPGIRYSRIDLDRDDGNEAGEYASTAAGDVDFGASGRQLDVGLTCYFNGHGNKTQLAYTRWQAEAGEADADIVRLQHQLNF